MKAWLALVLTLASLCANSQTLQSFNYLGDKFSGFGYFGVAYSNVRMKNDAVPQPDMHDLQGHFLELNYKHQNLAKGKWQYDLRGKMYTDVIKQLIDMIVGNNSVWNQSESTGLSTGPIGWHTFAYNTLETKKFLFSPGIHANDYFFFTNARSKQDEGREFAVLTTQEPQGYYFGAGPSLLVSVLPSKFLLINFKSQYSFTYWRPVSASGAIVNDNYPKPHFVGLTTEFVTPWGVFFEIDHNRIINRGNIPNTARRTDFNIGFKFVKDN